MINIFAPYRTGLTPEVMKNLRQIPGAVLLLDYSHIDITNISEEQVEALQMCSLDKILETGKVKTFLHKGLEYIWNPIGPTFRANLFSIPEGETITGVYGEAHKRIAELDKILAKDQKVLIVLMHDLFGWNSLLFSSERAVNFVLPYLSVSDKGEENNLAMVEGVLTATADSPLYALSVSAQQKMFLRLHKVEFPRNDKNGENAGIEGEFELSRIEEIIQKITKTNNN